MAEICSYDQNYDKCWRVVQAWQTIYIIVKKPLAMWCSSPLPIGSKEKLKENEYGHYKTSP